MEKLHNEYPTDLLQMLQDAAPVLDCRSRERLKIGIEALIAENRALAARAVRVELERDALLAALGRQGIVYDADGRPVQPGDLPGHRALRG